MGIGKWIVRVSLGFAFMAAGAGPGAGAQDPPAPAPKLDRYGDPLPEGAVARLGTLRYRQSNIISLAYSPDGSQIASAGFSGEDKRCEVRLFDARSGKVIRRFIPALKEKVGETFPINLPRPTVVFSPDAKLVAAGCPDWTVHLWDVQSGREVSVFENQWGYTNRPLGKRYETVPLAISRDGKVLASAGFGSVISLWDIATGRKLHELRAGDPKPSVYTGCQNYYALVFSADGKSLFSGGSGGLLRWDLGSEREEVWDNLHFLFAMDLSKKGDLLAVGGLGESLSIWNVAEKKVVSAGCDQEYFMGLAFAPDGKSLAAASFDDILVLHDVPSLKEVGRLQHYWAASVAYSPDGTRVAAAWLEGASIRLWDIERGEDGPRTFVEHGEEDLRFLGHRHHAECVVFLPDGKTLASSGWRWVRFWDLASQTEVRRWSCGMFPRHVNAIAVSPDGKAFVAGGTEALRIREVDSGQDIARFLGHGGDFGYIKKPWHVNALALSPDGKYGCSAGSPSKYNGKRLPGPGDEGPVRLWDAHTGKEILDFDGPSTRAQLSFSPDSKFLAGPRRRLDARPSDVGLWEVPSGRLLRTFTGHDDSVVALAFSPDRRTLASGAFDGRVIIWDFVTGDELRRLEGHEKDISSVAYSPDGRLLATASDRSIRIWQMPEGRLLRKLKGHEAEVNSVCFSPDGKLLASASRDTTVLVWDVAADLLKASGKGGGGGR
jgi:WD40 repeat protein